MAKYETNEASAVIAISLSGENLGAVVEGERTPTERLVVAWS